MQYPEPYKLQINLEISDSNILEILSQMARLTVNFAQSTPTSVLPDTPSEISESQIVSFIHEIGVPSHIMGYKYLKDSILATLKNPEYINAITKVLYPEIAAKHHTTTSRVERAIRHAIELSFTRGNTEVLTSLFGFSINPNTGRPTNSEFIAAITDYLRTKNL